MGLNHLLPRSIQRLGAGSVEEKSLGGQYKLGRVDRSLQSHEASVLHRAFGETVKRNLFPVNAVMDSRRCEPRAWNVWGPITIRSTIDTNSRLQPAIAQQEAAALAAIFTQ
jgi:hypothetical protein